MTNVIARNVGIRSLNNNSKATTPMGRSWTEVTTGLTEIKVYDKSNRETEEDKGEVRMKMRVTAIIKGMAGSIKALFQGSPEPDL